MIRQSDPGAGGNRPPDGYEASYMSEGGDVVFRHKMKAPWWMSLLFLLPVAFVWIVYALGGSKPAPIYVPLILTPLLSLIWLMFAVIRVTVTKTRVVIQYGLFGPTIPVEAIISHEEIDYDWTQTSYGIHKGPDGSWVYNMFGDGAHGLKIVYREGGKTKSVIVGIRGAAELASAVTRAREGVLGEGEPKVRVGELGKGEDAIEPTPTSGAEGEPVDAETAESPVRRREP